MICFECSTPVPSEADPETYECKGCGELASTGCDDCSTRMFVTEPTGHACCDQCAEDYADLRAEREALEQSVLAAEIRGDALGDQMREEGR